jgi:hypothetical protein
LRGLTGREREREREREGGREGGRERERKKKEGERERERKKEREREKVYLIRSLIGWYSEVCPPGAQREPEIRHFNILPAKE